MTNKPKLSLKRNNQEKMELEKEVRYTKDGNDVKSINNSISDDIAIKSMEEVKKKQEEGLQKALNTFEVSGLEDLLDNLDDGVKIAEKPFEMESNKNIRFNLKGPSEVISENKIHKVEPVVTTSAGENKQPEESITPKQDHKKPVPKGRFNLNLKDSRNKKGIRETFKIEKGELTLKQKEEEKRRQEEYLRKHKPTTLGGKIKMYLPYAGLGVSAVATVFMGVNIFLWYFNGETTTDIMSEIRNSEMVGIIDNNDKIKKDDKPFVGLNFKDLKKNNADTVAWLKYDALEIDMPITQTKDNEYYLNHDINRNESSLGWVFADARANMEYLGQNTVLYGHNLSSQQMFGNLKRIFSLDPEQKKKNEIIQFTTESQSLLFEIVSVYVTEYTDWTYVQPIFATLDQKKKFIERTQKRNEMAMFKRNDLGVNDQFLTFSTCYGAVGTKDRLVIVGRLVAQQPNYDNIKEKNKSSEHKK